MTDDERARALVDKFKMETKDSEYTVIEGDDADQLILDIASALREARRLVWEEVAKGLEHKRAVLWEKKSVELFNYVIVWCRQQAREEER